MLSVHPRVGNRFTISPVADYFCLLLPIFTPFCPSQLNYASRRESHMAGVWMRQPSGMEPDAQPKVRFAVVLTTAWRLSETICDVLVHTEAVLTLSLKSEEHQCYNKLITVCYYSKHFSIIATKSIRLPHMLKMLCYRKTCNSWGHQRYYSVDKKIVFFCNIQSTSEFISVLLLYLLKKKNPRALWMSAS